MVGRSIALKNSTSSYLNEYICESLIQVNSVNPVPVISSNRLSRVINVNQGLRVNIA